MDRYVCIHGHFYQPPRENPWLETVELQDSAAPYHDWNERITAECYARNASARMLDSQGRIEQIVNNYARISFNFGPTLLAWLKERKPWVHDAIVRADKEARERFSGHGSALAQVYNHIILPLANERDRHTQILWGIRDFEYRFGRRPEGLWLSETAADTPTLETLAEHGIKFTILSPHQASRMREIGARSWRDVNGGRIDPTRPYLMRFRSGRSIAIFFYDGPVSQAVAFERLLESGERFAHRLTSAFSDTRKWNQLVHIATDGESYGHHHRRGEMALAYALQFIEKNGLARLTNYGEYLARFPPTHEVQIHEGSAWSCSHGVGRWMSHCGCNSGGRAGWQQHWRAPLRHALDWLRDSLAPLFERRAREFVKEPWTARQDYIYVILDRSPENLEKYFSRHAARPLSESDRVAVLKLMEMQRHAMLMYTSCGWFFDEISGIEAVQVMQYAGRAIQLGRQLFKEDFEPGFLERVAHAKSNIPEHGDGKGVYEKFVAPAMVDWENVTAHYAISSLFERPGDRSHVFLYDFEELDRHFLSAGRVCLAIGTVRVTFAITRETQTLSYGMLYLGEHNVTGGVTRFATPEAFQKMLEAARSAFEQADYPQTIRVLDLHFGAPSYSIRSLFRDQQRRVLDHIMASAREDVETRYRLIAERYTPLLRFLADLGVPPPAALETAAEFVAHRDLRRQFEAEEINLERLEALLKEAQTRHPRVLDAELGLVINDRMEVLMQRIKEDPDNLDLLDQITRVACLLRPLPMDLNLWRVRNFFWSLHETALPEKKRSAALGNPDARQWTQKFLQLGDALEFANMQAAR